MGIYAMKIRYFAIMGGFIGLCIGLARIPTESTRHAAHAVPIAQAIVPIAVLLGALLGSIIGAVAVAANDPDKDES